MQLQMLHQLLIMEYVSQNSLSSSTESTEICIQVKPLRYVFFKLYADIFWITHKRYNGNHCTVYNFSSMYVTVRTYYMATYMHVRTYVKFSFDWCLLNPNNIDIMYEIYVYSLLESLTVSPNVLL